MINQEYHFDITPHIVKQLGEQLVSDEITALLELIKILLMLMRPMFQLK